MFKHEKQLLHPVAVSAANPQYAALMQEQLGGKASELSSAMQYMAQSYRAKDPEIHALFLKIAAEELGHMEMVAQAIHLLNGHDVDYRAVSAGELQSQTQFGLSPALINSSGIPWTAAYLDVTGDLAADLLSDVAAEQRAKVTYQYLYRQINDPKLRESIDWLLNQEEEHSAQFRAAYQRIRESGSNMDFFGLPPHTAQTPAPQAGAGFRQNPIEPPAFQE